MIFNAALVKDMVGYGVDVEHHENELEGCK
jgi:hypothetical protein